MGKTISIDLLGRLVQQMKDGVITEEHLETLLADPEMFLIKPKWERKLVGVLPAAYSNVCIQNIEGKLFCLSHGNGRNGWITWGKHRWNPPSGWFMGHRAKVINGEPVYEVYRDPGDHVQFTLVWGKEVRVIPKSVDTIVDLDGDPFMLFCENDCDAHQNGCMWGLKGSEYMKFPFDHVYSLLAHEGKLLYFGVTRSAGKTKVEVVHGTDVIATVPPTITSCNKLKIVDGLVQYSARENEKGVIVVGEKVAWRTPYPWITHFALVRGMWVHVVGTESGHQRLVIGHARAPVYWDAIIAVRGDEDGVVSFDAWKGRSVYQLSKRLEDALAY